MTEPAEEFKIGDVVKLKTHMGPTMVIVGRDAGEYSCAWFTKVEYGWSGPHHGRFPSAALEKTEA